MYFNEKVLRILTWALIFHAHIGDPEVNLQCTVSVVSRDLLRNLIYLCKLVKAELCSALIRLLPAYITTF